MARKTVDCSHEVLRLIPSKHALEAGYIVPDERKRAAATTPGGFSIAKSQSKKENGGKALRQSSSILAGNPETFPGPLLLQGDDLALDPHYPPQSLRSWLREKDRNEVTKNRRTIYVAGPPGVGEDVHFMGSWSQPKYQGKTSSSAIVEPELEDVIKYLAALYRGLPVKKLPLQSLSFTQWDSDGDVKLKPSKIVSPNFVGLTTSSECVRIRTRPSPDTIFRSQLNLDDLLDAAISILPKDAYALLLLVEQDLFESDDDEFVCGRAYGGSRVAVISTARYNPNLDIHAGIDRNHAWPASHCAQYIATCLGEQSPHPASKAETSKEGPERGLTSSDAITILDDDDDDIQVENSPLQAAVSAHNSLPSFDSSAVLSGLWLGRVCRTAFHEIGHCFGIDHCVYYACAMQGSATLIEDSRQPPYLCPVDLAKVLRATGASEEEHLRALLAFCEVRKEIHLFAGYGAWIRQRLAGMT